MDTYCPQCVDIRPAPLPTIMGKWMWRGLLRIPKNLAILPSSLPPLRSSKKLAVFQSSNMYSPKDPPKNQWENYEISLSLVNVQLLHRTSHTAPFFPNTAYTVLSRIFISNQRLHSRIYLVSRSTISSKSVMLLLPLTCHMPVIPGLIASLAR